MCVVCELALPKHHMMTCQETPPLESKKVLQFSHDEDLGLNCGWIIIYIVGIKKRKIQFKTLCHQWIQIAVRAVE